MDESSASEGGRLGIVEKDLRVRTWAAHAGAGENAVVGGDFVVTAKELQIALESFRSGARNIRGRCILT